MDYEKLYKEANKKVAVRFGSNVAKELFPDLYEPKDEMIRKAIIKHFRQGTYYISFYGFSKNEILAWLEKQGEKPIDKIQIGKQYKCIASPRYSTFMRGKIYKPEDKFLCSLMNFCSDCFEPIEGEQKPNYCHHEVDLSGCSEEYRKAYYDGWNNCNMQHSQCRSELDDVVKCLINGMKFYYEDNKEATWGTDKWSMPVKHIIEVLEKQCEQKSYGQRQECVDCQFNYAGECKGSCAMKRGGQKPADKVEPKFHEGDWVFIEEVKGYKNGPFQIKTVDSFGYSFDEYHTIPFMYEDLLSKWTIQDAKDGDILYINNMMLESIMIYKSFINNGVVNKYASYNKFGFEGETYLTLNDGYIIPATKDQRDTLFTKMKEAGYEWDAEKKELKKIESAEWSEEDEKILNSLISSLARIGASTRTDSTSINYTFSKEIDWLKSLRPQNKCTYNPYKEVVKSIADMCNHYGSFGDASANDFINNIRVKCKDAKEYDKLFTQSTWKPSEEQIKAVRLARSFVTDDFDENPTLSDVLVELEKQLKKLRKE